ncbi:hypothetical protein OG604_03505 [Streptomyces sp. NBC_01231]|nr:hypothetical protein OG604_03505 [Streptomyces sp. NBC_01231]
MASAIHPAVRAKGLCRRRSPRRRAVDDRAGAGVVRLPGRSPVPRFRLGVLTAAAVTEIRSP